MTTRRRARFSLTKLRSVLESAGWDTDGEETLTAEMSNAQGHFRVVIDKGGRVMLRRTALIDQSPGQVIHAHGRSYALHTESIAITHITTTLTTEEEFNDILAEMMELALSASQK